MEAPATRPVGPLVVLVDGRLDAGRSRLDGSPTGLEVGGGPGRDGAFLRLHVREGSHLTLLEEWRLTEGATGATRSASEVVVGSGASLEHVKLQAEPAGGHPVSRIEVHLEQDAHYSLRLLSLGGTAAEEEVHATLVGEGARFELAGLLLAGGNQRMDARVLVDHERPRGWSRQTFRGVVAGHARGAFHGGVRVRPGAQGTDARQTSRGLLLSETATLVTRPELEIEADDVKCAHGAAIGTLDPDAIFYLRSRGMDETEARLLLIRGFASEVLESIPDAGLRAGLQAAVEGCLAAGEFGT